MKNKTKKTLKYTIFAKGIFFNYGEISILIKKDI